MLPEHSEAACKADEGAEIDKHAACGHALRQRLPERREIAVDQAQDSEANQGRRKDCVTDACDAHRLSPGLSPAGLLCTPDVPVRLPAMDRGSIRTLRVSDPRRTNRATTAPGLPASTGARARCTRLSPC